MVTLVGASGGGFLGGEHLAVIPLFGVPAGVPLGPAIPRVPRPGCHRLEKSRILKPCEYMGSMAGEVGTISLEKIIFPKEGRPRTGL